jgi:hypothetical protein
MQGNSSSALRMGLIFSSVGMALGRLVFFTNHNTLPKTLGGVAFVSGTASAISFAVAINRSA